MLDTCVKMYEKIHILIKRNIIFLKKRDYTKCLKETAHRIEKNSNRMSDLDKN